MKAGFSKRDITPSRCSCLAGFAPVREMEGAHDKLYVKTVFCSVRGEIYGCVSYDLLAVDHLLVDPILDFLKKRGVPKEHVLVSAIHTHSAPGGLWDTEEGCLRMAGELLGDRDEELIAGVLEATYECMAEALDNMEEADLYKAYGECGGIGSNRNERHFQGNDGLFCMEIRTRSKKMLLVNFACHPTVLNAANKLCSADYPGEVQRRMEQRGYELTMLLNGSCGDISTRFTRQGSGYEEVDRYGKIMEEALTSLLDNKKPVQIHTLRAKRVAVVLCAKTPLEIEEAEKEVNERRRKCEEGIKNGVSGVEKRLLESMLEGAQADLRYARNYDNTREYKVELAFYQINDHIFAAVPGEMFSQLTNPLQDETTHFIGYANGYMMYFADEYAYEHMYYEALSSPFKKGEAEKLVLEIKREIEKWRDRV